MYFKRVIYLGYYLKELDRNKFIKFLNYSLSKSKKSRAGIILDIVRSSLKFNISIMEYFLFHFYRLSKEEREDFVGTGYIYEYQLLMNPKSVRSVLENKIEFLNHYKAYIRHQFISLDDLIKKPNLGTSLLENKSRKVVVKSSSGQCGSGVEVIESQGYSADRLIAIMKKTGNDLAEEFVVQHEDLMKLSPSGLNTVRIVTQLTANDDVVLLAARLRISINSPVDNMAAGNVAAAINIETGLVEGPGVYSDITKNDETVHPVTGVSILNFKIPFWKEAIEMVKQAALNSKGNRSIGWDVAITNSGPGLIEGNHNWCKLLWQLPVKKGLKSDLEKYK